MRSPVKLWSAPSTSTILCPGKTAANLRPSSTDIVLSAACTQPQIAAADAVTAVVKSAVDSKAAFQGLLVRILSAAPDPPADAGMISCSDCCLRNCSCHSLQPCSFTAARPTHRHMRQCTGSHRGPGLHSIAPTCAMYCQHLDILYPCCSCCHI